MCMQPFVFMSNEMCSAIIRGGTEVEKGGAAGVRVEAEEEK